MKPLTKKIPKALVEVAGKTLLEWAIERYTSSGIDDIVISVGWKGAMIEDFVKDSKLNVNVVHVHNYETGPLQTLLSAIETFDGDFLLSPVDAMIEPSSVIGLLEHKSKFGTPESIMLAVSSNAKFGTLVELGDDGLVLGIGEAGDNPKNVARSAMMLIGHTRVRGLCKSIIDSGNERVTHLLEELLKNGDHVQYFDVTQPWFDIDTLSDLLDTNHHILRRGAIGNSESVLIPYDDSIEIGDTLSLKSRITLGKGIYLQGPVLIFPNCEIGDYCKIGPNVTIGSNSTMSIGCELTDTILFGESKLSPRSRVHKSVIYDSIEYNVEV
nr:MAG: hypothetical protein AM325_00185 [Candidatus Thorarchaeota archaeon SMTZ1-45]